MLQAVIQSGRDEQVEYIAQSVGGLCDAEQLVRSIEHVRHRLSEDRSCVASGDMKYAGAVYEVCA